MMILVLGIIAVIPLFAVGTMSHKRAIDQTQTSLIAPRIAAAIQENLTESDPKNIKDGEFIEYGRSYRYDASFGRLVQGSASDPLADAAFALRVVVKWSEGDRDHREVFDTVVLRRIPR